jgi:hypothetical protein
LKKIEKKKTSSAKLSVLRSITDNSAAEQQPPVQLSTDGIDINKWKMTIPGHPQIDVSGWDFAGAFAFFLSSPEGGRRNCFLIKFFLFLLCRPGYLLRHPPVLPVRTLGVPCRLQPPHARPVIHRVLVKHLSI